MCYNANMKLNIPQSLKELAKYFSLAGNKLYIVGGFVRNSLLGFVETDFDICGPMKYEDVETMLQNSVFDVTLINKNLGTLHIKSKISEEVFEYTTFRKESYSQGGAHRPEKVVFVKDIKKDAIRRDFTCNAIYYDIFEDKIVDLFSGVQDTLQKTLRTVNVPDKTFDDDGLRILRLARISAELDFDVNEECYITAKEKISNLKDISQERFHKEILQMLFADYKYDAINNPNCPTKAINFLNDWGAWGYILRSLSLEHGMQWVNEKLSKPWVQYLDNADAIHRVSVFTYEILRALDLPINLENVDKILGQNGLMLSKKEVRLQADILTALNEQNVLHDEAAIRKFIQKNHKIILRVIDLSKIFVGNLQIEHIYHLMKLDKVPMSLKDLAIGGQDLIKFCPEIKKENYSYVLNSLLEVCALMPEFNTKENLLTFIKREIK